MKKRRLPAVFLLFAMLFGLSPAPLLAQVPSATYNPYRGVGSAPGGFQGDPRYQRGYGQRYNPDYYNNAGSGYSGGHGFTKIIPPAVGAVMGLAMGAKFGWVGALVGGTIGLFGGKAISSAIFGESYYQGGQSGYFQASNQANYIPGMIGALIGGFMGSSFGVVGMILGSGVGYLVGKGIAKLMFPNLYYGGSYFSPGGGGGFYPNAPGDAEVRVEGAPASPVSSQASLAQLKDVFYQSMRSYKLAMEGENEQEILSRRKVFLDAQRAYLDAKRAAQ
jgi:hypothetical protein